MKTESEAQADARRKSRLFCFCRTSVANFQVLTSTDGSASKNGRIDRPRLCFCRWCELSFTTSRMLCKFSFLFNLYSLARSVVPKLETNEGGQSILVVVVYGAIMQMYSYSPIAPSPGNSNSLKLKVISRWICFKYLL